MPALTCDELSGGMVVPKDNSRERGFSIDCLPVTLIFLRKSRHFFTPRPNLCRGVSFGRMLTSEYALKTAAHTMCPDHK
jgi:hypothetical protein